MTRLRKLLFFIVFLSCACAMHAQRNYFLQVPLRKGYRVAYNELMKDGYRFRWQRGDEYTFDGKYGEAKTKVMITLNADSAITEVVYEFIEPDMAYAQAHYENMQKSLIEAYGVRKLEQVKEEPKGNGDVMDFMRKSMLRSQEFYVRNSVWETQGGTVTLSLDLIDVSLRCVVDMEYDPNTYGDMSFLNQSLDQSMRDYCYHIQEHGFQLFGEFDEAMLYKGLISGVPNTNLIVYGTPDQQKVTSVVIIYPEGKHWEGEDDYTTLRDKMTKAYGRDPHKEGEKDGEPIAIWSGKDVTVSLTRSEGQVMMLFINNNADSDSDTAEQTPAKQDKDEEPDENSELYCQGVLIGAKKKWEEGGRNDKDMLLLMAVYSSKLASMYSQKGWHTTAVNYYRQALEYLDLHSGKRTEDYVLTLFNLSVAYAEMGDVEQAEKAIRNVLALLSSVTLENARNYFLIYRGASMIYQDLGKFFKAEEMNDQMMTELPRLQGEEHDEMLVAILHDRYSLNMNMGNEKDAKQYLSQELSVLQRTRTEPYVQYALCYGGFGVISLNAKEYEQAIAYFQRALSNLVNVDERNKKIYEASIQDNMGIAYAYIGRTDEAIAISKQAAETYRTVFSADHPGYAQKLINIAYAYSQEHDYQKALEYSEQAKQIFVKALGDESSETMLAWFNVGAYNSSLAHYDEAEQAFRKSIVIAKKNYQQALDYMSEFQREQFWNKCNEMLQHEELMQFVYRHSQERPSVAEFAYDNELFSKGLLLASTEMVRRSIEESGKIWLIDQYEQLSALKERIFRMEQSGKTSHELDSCKQLANTLEKEVTRESAAFRQNEEMWNISWTNVRNALHDKQIAIEFTRLPLSEDSTMYAALLLRAGDAYPRMIPLFEEREVTSILQTTNPDTQYDYNRGGWSLFRPIWSKILPYLHYGDTVYYAATGVLHQIAIETLPFSANQTISSLFHMVRLSSTRELAMQHAAAGPSTAVLYGGIYYDMELDELMAQSEHYTNMSIAGTRAVADESLRAGVHYLPGTKREVEAIGAILRPNHINTRVYTSGAANEESFKALSGQHTNILHIATHGFYWTDSTAREQRYFSHRSVSTGNMSMSIDPLTRSGLLFAGANIALRGHSRELPQNVQDGILTSKEISLLDLRGADLVILSACETGKGEITGEGVFGLQRAFKMAGAQTILMSLWPVDDEATQMMTTEFYRHWINLHESKREAFLHAQMAVRARYEQPKYWAAFILLD